MFVIFVIVMFFLCHVSQQQQRQQPQGAAVGWQCPQCTYVNVPTRPGCEQCACDRPQDYVVPAHCPLDVVEIQRLAREAAQEEIAKVRRARRLA